MKVKQFQLQMYSEKFIEKFNAWNARTNIFTKGCIDNI